MKLSPLLLLFTVGIIGCKQERPVVTPTISVSPAPRSKVENCVCPPSGDYCLSPSDTKGGCADGGGIWLGDATHAIDAPILEIWYPGSRHTVYLTCYSDNGNCWLLPEPLASKVARMDRNHIPRRHR